ncbi:glutamate-gated chloride channel-like isoform X2 [Palaemon carinicauda]|uniref:glutamate-gated chloride channel-like isoform X2 n=1 Tax=Palaemon carinicauda TaxID=392227 RepID=UPI0035B5EF5E
MRLILTMLYATFVLLLAVSVGRAEDDDPQAKATAAVLSKLKQTNPQIRPSVDNGPTTAKVQAYVRNMDVDDVDMKITLDMTFRMRWNDYRLEYDEPGVNNVVVLNPKMAWIPDAFFKNAFTTQYKSVHPENYLRVYPDGNVTYSTRLSVDLSCPMNLVRFPHDTQECKMQIASYGYTTKDLILVWREETPTEISQFLHGGRFSLDRFDTGYCNSRTSTGDYSCVSVSVVIKRDFGAYLLELYLPTIFLIVVAWFSFFIPFEQFLGRLLLTLIPLISLASFTNTFTKGLASVPYIKAFDIFTGFSLCVIFLTLVHIVVCYIKGLKSTYTGPEGSEDPEEGGAKNVEVEETSGFKKVLKKAKAKAEFLSRTFLVGFYIAFLFVYFAAYCGTG